METVVGFLGQAVWRVGLIARKSSKRLFVALYRLFVRSKSPVRKCERRLGLESLEYRKYLSAVVNIQPLIVNAGDVGELRVTVKGAITEPGTIVYAVTNGSAVLGSDFFVPRQGEIVLQPGEKVAKLIPVLTQADSAATGNKSFTVSLSDPIGGVSLGTTQAQCTIVEPDANAATRLGDGQGRQTDNQSATSATVSISGPTTAVTAGTSANLTVTLSAASSSIVSAYYQTVDGTASAGVNYCSAGGGPRFPRDKRARRSP